MKNAGLNSKYRCAEKTQRSIVLRNAQTFTGLMAGGLTVFTRIASVAGSSFTNTDVTQKGENFAHINAQTWIMKADPGVAETAISTIGRCGENSEKKHCLGTKTYVKNAVTVLCDICKSITFFSGAMVGMMGSIISSLYAILVIGLYIGSPKIKLGLVD